MDSRIGKFLRRLSGWALAIGSAIAVVVGGVLAVIDAKLILVGALVALIGLFAAWWFARFLYENAVLIDQMIEIERNRRNPKSSSEEKPEDKD